MKRNSILLSLYWLTTMMTMMNLQGKNFVLLTCLLEGWFFVVPVEPLEEHLLPVCLSSPSSVLVLVSRLGDRHRVLSELPLCLLEMVGRSKLLEVGGDTVPLSSYSHTEEIPSHF